MPDQSDDLAPGRLLKRIAQQRHAQSGHGSLGGDIVAFGGGDNLPRPHLMEEKCQERAAGFCGVVPPSPGGQDSPKQADFRV